MFDDNVLSWIIGILFVILVIYLGIWVFYFIRLILPYISIVAIIYFAIKAKKDYDGLTLEEYKERNSKTFKEKSSDFFQAFKEDPKTTLKERVFTNKGYSILSALILAISITAYPTARPFADKGNDEPPKQTENKPLEIYHESSDKTDAKPTKEITSVDKSGDKKEKPQEEEIQSSSKETAPIESDSQNTFQEAYVSEVVDGDTIKVQIDGQEYKVRLIGVDTPETVHPSKPVEFYGKEASNFTKKTLSGKTVYLQKDVSETDRYSRLLRYVRLSRPQTDEPTQKEVVDKMFNAYLVRQGYAHSATFPPDVKYQEIFALLEKEASDENIGLWNPEAEEEFNNQGTQEQSTETGGDPNQKRQRQTAEVTMRGRTYTADVTQGPVKGNSNSKIYHVQGQQGYDKISVNNCVRFNTVEEAQQAGYRPAKR